MTVLPFIAFVLYIVSSSCAASTLAPVLVRVVHTWNGKYAVVPITLVTRTSRVLLVDQNDAIDRLVHATTSLYSSILSVSLLIRTREFATSQVILI